MTIDEIDESQRQRDLDWDWPNRLEQIEREEEPIEDFDPVEPRIEDNPEAFGVPPRI